MDEEDPDRTMSPPVVMPIFAALLFECLTNVSRIRLFSSSKLELWSLTSFTSFSNSVYLRAYSFSITSAASTTSSISFLLPYT